VPGHLAARLVQACEDTKEIDPGTNRSASSNPNAITIICDVLEDAKNSQETSEFDEDLLRRIRWPIVCADLLIANLQNEKIFLKQTGMIAWLCDVLTMCCQRLLVPDSQEIAQAIVRMFVQLLSKPQVYQQLTP